MKRVLHTILLFLIISPFVSQINAQEENLYLEESEGFSRIGSETFRWAEKREFLLADYSFYENNGSTYVTAEILDKSNYGSLQIIDFELKKFNFIMNATFQENGDLANIEWSMVLFRLPVDVADPFANTERQILVKDENERFDLKTNEINFTVSLEYFEFRNIENSIQKIRVNTELTSDNELDGRIIRTAIHIIKRDPDGKTIFDFNWSIKQVDAIYRILNFTDQPILWVPLRLGGAFLLVYLYIRGYKFLQKNKVQIFKNGEPFLINFEDSGDEEVEEETEET